MKQKSIYFRIAAALTAILLLLPVLGGCKKEQRDPQDLGYFLSLSESSITLSQGASQMLTATFSPASALVLWESGDDKLLEVKDGVVTAKGENGNAVITAKLVTIDDFFTPKATATCQVKVQTVFVQSITLPSTLPLSMGTSYQLKPVISPEDAQGAGLEYQVTDGTEYVSVSETGELTPKSVTPSGVYATVTVTAKDAHHASASVKVSVGEKAIYPTEVSLNSFVEETSIGKDFYVSLNFTPASANWRAFTVESGNPAVATVAPYANSGFTVSPKSAGETTITLTWESETSKDNKIQKTLTVHEGEPSIAWSEQMDFGFVSTGVIIDDNIPLKVDVKNLNNKSVVYSSSNPSVASVSASGIVTAWQKGWVTITARAEANSSLSVNTGQFYVYGKPATLYFSQSVDNGFFVRYGTSKSLNVIVRDASGSASRQDLLNVSFTKGSGMNVALDKAVGTDQNVLTFTGKRSSASTTIPGTLNLSVKGYSDLNTSVTVYDAMYDEYDVKPFDGIRCTANGLVVYDGGYRGSGYFSVAQPPTGQFRTKSQGIIVHIGGRPSAKSALGNLPGLSRSQAPSLAGIHGLAVYKANLGTGDKWWTVSANSGDEVCSSTHYTSYWSGGKSDPMYVSTTNNEGYGYEITTAMKHYNADLSSGSKYTVLPVKAIVDNMPAAGANNSGWYLPTSAEWDKMLTCLGTDVTPGETVNKLSEWMTAMDGGAAITTYNYYWSCQEASSLSHIKAVYLTGNKRGAFEANQSQDKTTTAQTRPFLAF